MYNSSISSQLYFPKADFWSHNKLTSQKDSDTPSDLEITGSFDQNFSKFWGNSIYANYAFIYCDKSKMEIKQIILLLRTDYPDPFPTQFVGTFQIISWDTSKIITKPIVLPGVSYTQRLEIDLIKKEFKYIINYENKVISMKLIDGNKLYKINNLPDDNK